MPYDEEKQNPEDDWSWLFPVEDASKAGEIVYTTYPGYGNVERPVEIYVPANYDAEREEPYKVLYLAHGGGGDEADWFYQGHANSIVDRMIDEGACEEFLMVCMNLTEFDSDVKLAAHYSWNVDALGENLAEYLIPYMEENYNVSKEAADRGYVGLSNGAKAVNCMMYQYPETFKYWGILSGSSVWLWPEDINAEALKEAKIYLGTALADQNILDKTYHTAEDKTITGLTEKFDEAGIPYNNGGSPVILNGTHDWFTWPVMLKDIIETMLWK